MAFAATEGEPVRLQNRVLLLILLKTRTFEQTVLLELASTPAVSCQQVFWKLEGDHWALDSANSLGRSVNALLFLAVRESSDEIRCGRTLVEGNVLISKCVVHDRWRLLATSLLV